MRARNISFLVCAVGATGLVGTLLILGARSEHQLQASLQRVDKLLDAGPSESEAGPAAPDKAVATLPADESNAGWRELFQKVAQWLQSTGYERLPIPALYQQVLEHLPPPPAAPDTIVAEIRRLAKLGGPTDPPETLTDWEQWRDHTDNLRTCALLAAEHSKWMLEQGEYAEAVDDLLTVMKVADLFMLEPLRESHEARHELYSSLQAYLQVRALPADLASPLIEHLAHADTRSSLRTALGGQLQQKLDLYEAWKNLDYGDAVDEAGLYWGTRSWLWSQDICRPWFNLDQQSYADMTARMLEVDDAPLYEVAPDLHEIETEIVRVTTPNRVVQDDLQRTFHLFADQSMHEARLDIMQLGLVIEQYFARQGQYPASLDAIAPQFGGALPLDPFTGESYHYALDENGFFVYAEGPGDGEGPAWRGTSARAPEVAAANDRTTPVD